MSGFAYYGGRIRKRQRPLMSAVDNGQLTLQLGGIPVNSAVEGDNLQAVATFSASAPGVDLYLRRGLNNLRIGPMTFSSGAWRFNRDTAYVMANLSYPGDQATGDKTWFARRIDTLVETNNWTVNIPDTAMYSLKYLRDRSRYQMVASVNPVAIGVVFRVRADLLASGTLISNEEVVATVNFGWRAITTAAGNIQVSVRQASGLFINNTITGLNLDTAGNLGKISTLYFHYEGIGGVGPIRASVNRGAFVSSANGTGYNAPSSAAMLATGLASNATTNPLYDINAGTGVVQSDVEILGLIRGTVSLSQAQSQTWYDNCKAANDIVAFPVGASTIQNVKCLMNGLRALRTWNSGDNMVIGGVSGVGLRKPYVQRITNPVWFT